MTDAVPTAETRQGLSPLKQAFLALEEAEARISELESRASEPIAVIGIGCRIPGAENGPEGFWRLLRDRHCSVSEKVAERLRSGPEALRLPGPARWAALLDTVDEFDPRHFGISPREAAGIDPQQRLLLEVSWEALENAAVDATSLYQTKTGVFIGLASHDYAQRKMQGLQLEAIDPHFASGVAPSVAAGRISYTFGFNGPAVSVDTACSSSLVAVHLACESLRRGECTTALAGGVNLILGAESSVAFAQAGMLSPRGVCSAFDQEADGFVRGEGCGIVVLKRLRAAEAAGDRILGVILASAVNQDGASSGLTVPNGMAQQALLRDALQRAGIEPAQVGYVEAHGTGTTLGDPIEAAALGAVFAGRQQKLPIGSVKTNIGHLEAAAGVSGLIKVLLGMEQQTIPAQLHLGSPTPHVRWQELPLEVVSEARPWAAIGGRRIAGVSSFGFSGTNAHIVVEGREPKPRAPETVPQQDVLVITARTESALRALTSRYAEFLAGSPTSGDTRTETWREICYTAGVGRAALSERLAIVAGTRQEAAARLRAWLAAGTGEGVYRGHVGAGQRSSRTAALKASPQEIAEAFVQGAGVDWRQRAGAERPRRVALPTYTFERERYWTEEQPVSGQAAAGGRATDRPILGNRLAVAGVRAQFETVLTSDGWIGENQVQGQSLLPATGHLELMLEAAAELGGGLIVEDVLLQARLTVDRRRRVQTVVEEEMGGRSRIRVYAEREAGWEAVSEGWLRQAAATPRAAQNPEAIRRRLQEQPAGETFYARMFQRGARFGEHFRGVRRLWSGDGEALGEIVPPEAQPSQPWVVQPWWLDACLQIGEAAAPGEESYLPMSLERIEIYARPGAVTWSHFQKRQADENSFFSDVEIFTPDGSPVARISGLRFRRVSAERTPLASWNYRVRWQEAGRPGDSDRKAAGAGRVLLIGDSPLARQLAAGFTARGISVTQCAAADLVRFDAVASPNTMVWVEDSSQNPEGIPGPSAAAATEASTSSLLRTGQHLAEQRSAARLYVVTAGAFAAVPQEGDLRLTATPLGGMAASLSVELPELRCTRLDMESDAATGEVDASLVLDEVLADAGDRLVAWRSGKRYSARLEETARESQPKGAVSRVRLNTNGGIDGLSWTAAAARDLAPHEVEIAVHATALNFHDVLQVLGVIADDGPLGTDCAGVVLRTGEAVTDLSPGDAVVAIAAGAFTSHAIAPRSLVVRKPAGLSFPQAAAQCVAYLTAAWCLEEIAKLQPGETILIHAAAGGVGLAAVHLARSRGARVIATAGSGTKRRYLRRLGVDEVYDSRSLAFAEQISGGVDVVLNSLAGEAIDAALSLLKDGGRFVEMGRTDLRDAGAVATTWPGVRYVPIDLTPLFAGESPWVTRRMTALLEEIAAGELPALPGTSFRAGEVKEAFRHMARAAHIGRVVVTQADDFSGTHIVTGGFRGLGLETAAWLGSLGAQRLVLVGRTPPDPAAQQVLDSLLAQGIVVEALHGDIGDPAVAVGAVELAGPELRGIWHAAGILENRPLAEQSPDSMRRVLHAKADGAWNLHQAARRSNLAYFVLFSSWASLGGSLGQINYCAANAFLDGLAHFRRVHALPALSVNWGAWAGTGMSASAELQRQLGAAGLVPMPPQDALEALRGALSGDHAQVAIAALHWPRYLAHQPDRKSDPLYSALHASPATDQGVAQTRRPESSAEGGAVRESLSELTSSAREAAVLRLIGESVRRTLDLHAGEEVDPELPLSDLGMDSLLAVELRNSLAGALERPLPSTLLFDYPTVRALARYLNTDPAAVTRNSDNRAVEAPAGKSSEAAGEPLDLLSAIEDMSDDEVEAMLERNSTHTSKGGTVHVH